MRAKGRPTGTRARAKGQPTAARARARAKDPPTGAATQARARASLFLALVVFAAVISVVASTMRLLLERRRLEVEVLRLVGATTRFVCRPFIIEGAIQGAAGAALAVVLLGFLYGLVRGRFDQQLATLLGVQPAFLPLSHVLGMLLVGAALGGATAWLSLRKAVKA